MRRIWVAALLGVLLCVVNQSIRAEETIVWEKWSDDIFERAKKENKFVLLDLEAVWCHWCHVMAEVTYKDPGVIKLMNSRYIAVRVDQDSRPDLSNRYEDYGWPATIVFGADGKEIVKRSAYIPPKPMINMLQAIIDDPTPGPSVQAAPTLNFATSASLPEGLRKQLETGHLERYDKENKGWGFTHKYLEWDSVEYCILRGDPESEKMAKEALTAQLALLDPAWGGVYQYSTGGKWDEPHFEKIMQHNAENLRLYSLAYAKWNDPAYLHAAQEIYRFLNTFLSSPDGAFYVSQDADLVQGEHSAEFFKLDDAGRRKLGVPRVDTHVYSRENGWAISAVCELYAATGDAACFDRAVKAANWIRANRPLEGGGFRHDEKDLSGPYLADTLAMGQAFLNLYAVSGDRAWLAQAESAAQFMQKMFGHDGDAGLATAVPPANAVLAPQRPLRDENVNAARFGNLLFHYTGKKEYRELAERAFKFLTAPEIAKRLPAAAVLLADYELANAPAHLVVCGAKGDAQAQALFKAAANYPTPYKRVEWYDRAEGALPNQDVGYPEMPAAAAFICANGRCSLPIKKSEALRGVADKIVFGSKKQSLAPGN
jgi:uncharacterized protein YyaL (SSP411 family)